MSRRRDYLSTEPDRHRTAAIWRKTFAVPDADTAFGEYMTFARGSKSGVKRLARLGREMTASDHPVVQYAAGWAAADQALLRHRTNEFDQERRKRRGRLDKRLALLEEAKTAWLKAFKDMPALQERLKDPLPKLAAEYCRLRALHDAAYIPLMEVAASMLASEPMSRQDVDARFQSVETNVIAAGSLIMQTCAAKPEQAPVMQMLMNGLVCGLAGQVDRSPSHLILPDSIRQNHNVFQSGHVDLVGISTEPPHRKAPIRVGTDDLPESSRLVVVHAERDLCLEGGGTIYDTFTAVGSFLAGKAEVNTAIALGGLSQMMAERLDAFHQHHNN